MDLTEKQRAVLDFLVTYRARNGRVPSYVEISQQFNFNSLNSARKHLQQLERKGYIKSPWGNQKRAVEILDASSPAPSIQIPLLGTVAAGAPLEVHEIPETIDVPEALVGDESFALRVRGESMKDDGILDGDVLIVDRREGAEDGQTVVALVDGEATVKRFYRRGGAIELRPANAAFSPIIASEESVLVQGVVVSLLRKYD